jgi:23S rRNA (cytosine1962-C5)-methyltransferase
MTGGPPGGQPARSAPLPRVVLRKNLARAIRGGHPWIYREALAAPEGLADGAVVFVVTDDRRAVARGFWDARSPIAVRVLATADEAKAVGPDLDAAVDARIGAALARRLAFIDRAATDAFRWIHGEADRLPGVHVDLYGGVAVVRPDGAGARAFYRGLPARLVAAAAASGVEVTAVVERGSGEGEGARAVLGALPEGELEVRENGVRFGVDLARGQKGGLFLDQRDNRALVRTLAAGKKVLNLFGYTGGFSLYAALGGAAETTTVDVAAPAIAAARRNFERNGLHDLLPDRAQLHAEDAFAFLERAAGQGRRWDLVISDPPSFAPHARALPAALSAYTRLHRLAAAVTAPGGTLCAASCSSHVGAGAFLETVTAGARAAGRTFTLVEMRGAAACHPSLPSFHEGDYLKFALGRVS